MSLLTRISVPPPTEPEPEDIFSSALTTIFTDDAVNSWGSPGSSITYQSPRYGAITLQVPVHPDEEQGRKLFAHYLWNAGVVAADAIENASNDGDVDALTEYGRHYWDVRGERVLEIGAGTWTRFVTVTSGG
jgi:EEF1A N-terminal glycine/lysine methyltransferase